MTTLTAATLSGTYALDPGHSSIGFVARHAMITKVRGTFGEVRGTIVVDAEEPSRSTAQVTIDAASVDTHNTTRDAHLRSGDFFDTEHHPEIVFASTAIEQVGDHRYRLTGDLTIRGTTNPVTIAVEHTGAATDPSGHERIGFEGTATVNRRDWGLTWNAALEAGGVLVGDTVTLVLDVAAIRRR